jgi:RNA polymerase sigma-70 factor (ECF subfamily)
MIVQEFTGGLPVMPTLDRLEAAPAESVKFSGQGRNRFDRATMHSTGHPIPDHATDSVDDAPQSNAAQLNVAEPIVTPADEGSGDTSSDAQLVRSAARGDGEAFCELSERHARRLFRLAVSLCGNAADAEDVLQETLAGAYQGLERFEGRSSVKTWLSRILVTQVARWRRGRRNKQSVSLEGISSRPDFECPQAEQSPVDSAVSCRMDLQAALQRLSGDHREVIVLREVEGLSYEQISEVLRIPRGTVESRLHRARAELRQHLQAYLP